MKVVLTWLALGFPAMAGNIFGTLFEQGRPAPAADITVNCGPANYQAKTDNDGSYRLFTKEGGKCGFRVVSRGRTAHTEIFSYNQPTRYDFEFEMQNGQWVLRRR